jgi:hypothetical protein
MLTVCTLDRIWRERHFISVDILPKTPYPILTKRITSDKSPLRDILQSTVPVQHSSKLSVIKTKENL